jgi:hypothetical protein
MGIHYIVAAGFGLAPNRQYISQNSNLYIDCLDHIAILLNCSVLFVEKHQIFNNNL